MVHEYVFSHDGLPTRFHVEPGTSEWHLWKIEMAHELPRVIHQLLQVNGLGQRASPIIKIWGEVNCWMWVVEVCPVRLVMIACGTLG